MKLYIHNHRLNIFFVIIFDPLLVISKMSTRTHSPILPPLNQTQGKVVYMEFGLLQILHQGCYLKLLHHSSM
ncbi:hypothetical protein Hanom_Chr05g00469761 [Helianthus anomalus]